MNNPDYSPDSCISVRCSCCDFTCLGGRRPSATALTLTPVRSSSRNARTRSCARPCCERPCRRRAAERCDEFVRSPSRRAASSCVARRQMRHCMRRDRKKGSGLTKRASLSIGRWQQCRRSEKIDLAVTPKSLDRLLTPQVAARTIPVPGVAHI
jgi:hypothetical protein